MSPGIREFVCTWEQCGKSFNRKSDLCRHYRIHTNERPYHCTVKGCNKSFIQRSALTVHSRTHTGEKPHVCDHQDCHKAFSDSSSLARHRRIHTGKRPYICHEPACERSFCRKTTLTKHLRRSHCAGTMTRPSSEEAMSEQSYHAPPIAITMPQPGQQQQQHHYLTTTTAMQQAPHHPQSFYQPPTPPQDFYPQPHPTTSGIQTTHVAAHDPIIVPHSIPVTSSVEAHHAHQQQMQMMRRYDPSQQEYFHHPTFTGHQNGAVANGLPVLYADLDYKHSPRILNPPEGTDWSGFLGVG